MISRYKQLSVGNNKNENKMVKSHTGNHVFMIVTGVLVNVITSFDVDFENSSCQNRVFKLACRLRVDTARKRHGVPPIFILRRLFVAEIFPQRSNDS